MIAIYHPSKNNNGFACSFSQSEKDDTIFATLIKQSTWDPQNQIGTFKASRNDPAKQVNVKLGQVEVAAILDSLDRNREFSTMHDGDKQIKSIKFTPWMNKVSEGQKPTQRGYSFSITITDKEDSSAKNSFYIGLTFPEGRLIREFLIQALAKSFSKAVKNSNQESF
jgi:hypothetical protein